jgi:transposase
VTIDGKTVTSPAAVYEGTVHQRDELNSQMERLKDERRDITNRLQGEEGEQAISAADKAGLEKRLTTLDGRIEALDNQIAQADAQVASAAAVPGAIVEKPPYVRPGPPEEVFILGGIFLFVAIFPISIAYARRIWRRSSAAVASLPHDIVERFTQIDQAVESIAVEVERIGEGQRFITRVLSEQKQPALAEPGRSGVEVRSRPNG